MVLETCYQAAIRREIILTNFIGNAATHGGDQDNAAAISETRHLSSGSLGGVEDTIAINVNDLLEFLCIVCQTVLAPKNP